MGIVRKLHRFHKSKTGYLTFGLIELVLAYIFWSIALDTANMWSYLTAVIFTIGAIMNLIYFIKHIHDRRSMKRKLKHAGTRHEAT